MKPIHKKRSLYGGSVLLLILLVGWIWNSWFSTTRIAFINYQVINLGISVPLKWDELNN